MSSLGNINGELQLMLALARSADSCKNLQLRYSSVMGNICFSAQGKALADLVSITMWSLASGAVTVEEMEGTLIHAFLLGYDLRGEEFAKRFTEAPSEPH